MPRNNAPDTATLLIVISGPSGVGKTTIIKSLLGHPETGPTLRFSISVTTRPPRPGEIHGVDYYFSSQEEFEKKIKEDAFIEWAKVHIAFYGTPCEELDRAAREGRDLLLEIDVQGAAGIKRKFPEALLIFLTISEEALRRRLENRPTALSPEEFKEEISLRMHNAQTELEQASHYDYVVINETLGQTVEEVADIIKKVQSSKFKAKR